MTCDCAWALFARAISSDRLLLSCSSFSFMPLRPDLSLSTTSVWEAICGSAVFASFSDAIWRCRATLARLSNLSAFAVSPDAR